MPRLNNDDQFQFLISCIRYSNNGKVDFTEVAKECNIVTKGAAAKRYERMMKAHGIYQGATARETSSKGDKSDKVDGTGSKKRKTDKVDKSNSTSDTEEVNPKKKVKDEVNGPVANRSGKIKTEFEYTSPDNDNFFHFTPVNDGSPSVEDDTFSEFLNSAAFETINGPSRFNDVQSGVEDMSPRGGDFLGGVGMGPNAGQFMPVADENQSSIIIDE